MTEQAKQHIKLPLKKAFFFPLSGFLNNLGNVSWYFCCRYLVKHALWKSKRHHRQLLFSSFLIPLNEICATYSKMFLASIQFGFVLSFCLRFFLDLSSSGWLTTGSLPFLSKSKATVACCCWCCPSFHTAPDSQSTSVLLWHTQPHFSSAFSRLHAVTWSSCSCVSQQHNKEQGAWVSVWLRNFSACPSEKKASIQSGDEVRWQNTTLWPV